MSAPKSSTVFGLAALGAIAFFAFRRKGPTPPPPEPGVPGAPTGVAAVAGDASATVAWQAPASDGGSPITGYEVSSGGAVLAAVGGAVTTAAVTGLVNGQVYTFTVAALNAIGRGPESAPSAPVTPEAPVPGDPRPSEPTNVVAAAGDGQVELTWVAPSYAGTTPIDRYRVRPIQNGTFLDTVLSPNGTQTSVTLTGFTNGQVYTFQVRAGNTDGLGPYSAESNAVTPQAPPPPVDPRVMLAAAAASQKNYLIRELGPLLHPGDTFVAVTGTGGSGLNVGEANLFCAEVRSLFPFVRCLVMTAGLANVQAVVAGAGPEVDGVIYNYAGGQLNEPEFSLDWPTVLANVDQFMAIIAPTRFTAALSITGDPVLDPASVWQWPALAARVPELVIQLRRYCRQGTWGQAIDAIQAQFTAAGSLARWSHQLSVDPNSVNGVSAVSALSCQAYAASRGQHDLELVWSVAGIAAAREFLAGVGR